ncbi:hypothetical protein HYT26_03725 [Candidatus Pacearchaeota archaeon]|nr:hypothetical protein [Candidatus Pacearchaeota archaeon]
MKNAVHVRLGYEEAISAKRNVLSCEIDSLHSLRNLKSYKRLRKQELTLTLRFRSQLKELVNKMSSLKNEMPVLGGGEEKLAIKSMKKAGGAETGREKHAKTGIEQEIMGIKAQLEAIS